MASILQIIAFIALSLTRCIVLGLFQTSQLIPDDSKSNDFFGSSLDVSGDYILVGAPGVRFQRGAAYLFQRTGPTSWVQTQKLEASEDEDRQEADELGLDVSIDGDFLILGAQYSTNAGRYSGAAYLYRKGRDGLFTYSARLLAGDATDNRFFGHAVAISGDYLAVSALGDAARGTNAGAVYVFKRDTADNTWKQIIKLLPDLRSNNDQFGYSLDMDDSVLVVGTPNGEASLRQNTGIAYVFIRQGTTWTLSNKISDVRGLPGDRFGESVAVSGGYIAVGAPDAKVGTLQRKAGQVHVFSSLRKIPLSSGNWTREATITLGNAYQFDRFGSSVALQGTTLVVGAEGNDDFGGNVGGAFLFARTGSVEVKLGSRTVYRYGNWSLTANLTTSDTLLGSGLGAAVAMDGDTVLVGSNNFNYDEGLAFIYTWNP